MLPLLESSALLCGATFSTPFVANVVFESVLFTLDIDLPEGLRIFILRAGAGLEYREVPFEAVLEVSAWAVLSSLSAKMDPIHLDWGESEWLSTMVS